MTQTITWINNKLEYILASLLGSSSIFLDIPNLLGKLLLAIVLGFLGGLGGWLWKLVANKLKKK